MGKPEFEPAVSSYFDRLNAIFSIRDIDLHIEEVTGEDKTVDLVVDIFNRVNSGGTKLSKGDLALARICAEWPDARDEMKKRLEQVAPGRLPLQARAAAPLHHDDPDRPGVLLGAGRRRHGAVPGRPRARRARGRRPAEPHRRAARPRSRSGPGQPLLVPAHGPVPRRAEVPPRGPARAGSAALLVCAHVPLGPLCGLDRDRAQPGPRADRAAGWRA